MSLQAAFLREPLLGELSLGELRRMLRAGSLTVLCICGVSVWRVRSENENDWLKLLLQNVVSVATPPLFIQERSGHSDARLP